MMIPGRAISVCTPTEVRRSWRAFIAAAVAVAACTDGSAISGREATLAGGVQKGPFVLGSSVEVAEVDGDGNPTGIVYSTRTINDLGDFSVELVAPADVAISASGFYWNEITGELSLGNLTLRAFYGVAASGGQQAYVNLVTHLAYPRVQALLAGGATMDAAVAQAEGELRTALGLGLAAFDPGAAGTDMNLLGGDSPANAYLFAVSAVLAQAGVDAAGGVGGSVDASLQELANTIAQDLAQDGTLSAGPRAKVDLAEAALDTAATEARLGARLTELGSVATVPNLDAVLDQDGDLLVNDADNCDQVPNPGQQDADGDGVGNACDNCPATPNANQADSNGNGVGDACEGGCGDGTVQTGEDCDDANLDETDACLSSCVSASCGDSYVWSGVEACDDGNGIDGDGCNADCVVSGTLRGEATFDADGGKDIAFGVAVDGTGNPIVAGRRSLGGVLDVWVRKYDPGLAEQWTTTYNNGEGSAYARGVVADAAGNVFTTGRLSFLASSGDVFVRKQDAAGAEVWITTYNGAGNSTDEGRGIALDGAGNVIAVGDTQSATAGVDTWIRKHGPDGSVVWLRTFDGGVGNTDRVHAVATGAGDSIFVTGEIRTSATQGGNIFVRQYNAAGATQWWKSLDYAGENDIGSAVAVSGGFFYIAGRVRNVANLDDVWTRKYSSAGAIQWTQLENGADGKDDVGRGVAVAPDGTIIVVGEEQRVATGVDLWARKYAADGSVLWTQVLDGGAAGEDRAYGVAVAADGSIFVAGQRGVSAADLDVWVLEFAP